MTPRPPLFDMRWIGASLSQHLVESPVPWRRIAGQVYAQADHALFVPPDVDIWATTQAIGAAIGARV